jgi:hypothetical protein
MKRTIQQYSQFSILVITVLTLSACNWFDSDDDKAVEPEMQMNTAPVAGSESLITQTEVVISTSFPASDADGDTLSFSITADPTLGSVTLGNGGDYTYTPNAEVTGNDSFSYSVSDGSAAPVSGVITITIEALQLSFSEYSREAFQQAATDTPLPVNGRVFIQDVVNQGDYQDLINSN